MPGNHDVPLYNLFARAFTPLSRYKRYITADTDPFYADPELAIAGINTARSLTIKGGRINSEQLAWVRRSFADHIEGYSALLIQAGTAISSRRRQEANSFNLIRIERPEIHLECRAWDLDKVKFVRSTSKSFRLGRSGWAPIGGTTIPTLIQNAEDGIVWADDRKHG